MAKTILVPSNPGVEAALKHPAIAGREVMARGLFSIVFQADDPNRVLKLTADVYVQKIYAANKNRLNWLPVCTKAYGKVGRIALGELEADLYLFEQEKLEPVANPEAIAVRDRIVSAWAGVDSLMQAGEGAATPITCLAYIVDQVKGTAEEKLLKKLLAVAKKQDDGNLRVNLLPKNFLQRSDGTLVCIDPFVDGRLADEAVFH